MSLWQIDIPGWLQNLGALAAGGGGTVIVVKLIEKAFARDDREAADRVSVSGELRTDIRDLKADVERMEKRLDECRERENRLRDECAELRSQVRELRAENIGLRQRYHDFNSFAAAMVGTIELYHRRLGLPESDLPDLPDWINRPVPGPTAREATAMLPPPKED